MLYVVTYPCQTSRRVPDEDELFGAVVQVGVEKTSGEDEKNNAQAEFQQWCEVGVGMHVTKDM